MAQYINKVIVNGETKIDLTSDSVDPSKLLSGATAHDKSGTPIVGILESKNIDDVQITDNIIKIPAGYYEHDITITFQDWLWNSLDFENSIITDNPDPTISEEKED